MNEIQKTYWSVSHSKQQLRGFEIFAKNKKRDAKLTDADNPARIMATPPFGAYSASLSYIRW